MRSQPARGMRLLRLNTVAAAAETVVAAAAAAAAMGLVAVALAVDLCSACLWEALLSWGAARQAHRPLSQGRRKVAAQTIRRAGVGSGTIE